ncbi:MAG: hypothetical protein Q7S02_06550 [bacterium]|nr:hypothetical protein [bacterium]
MHVAVLLDDHRFGSGPGTVVAVFDETPCVKQYYQKFADRDGALDPRMRLWGVPEGETTHVGERVEMLQLRCGTGEIGTWEKS